jgi:hypothetical protein
MPFTSREGSGPWHDALEQVRPSTALVLYRSWPLAQFFVANAGNAHVRTQKPIRV